MPRSETCDTCCWYRSTTLSRGECRRRAPFARGWPLVWCSDGCSEHQVGDHALPPPVWDDAAGGGLPLHDPAACRFCQEQTTAVPLAPEG